MPRRKTQRPKRGIALDAKLARVRELAQRYGVSKTQWYRWRERGLLPDPIKLGERTVLYDIAACDAAIEKAGARLMSAAPQKSTTS